jgi:hypothetical protein
MPQSCNDQNIRWIREVAIISNTQNLDCFMLTIFTIPKAFTGHSDVIQRNALQSWKSLGDSCEIFVCGDDPGVGTAASELEVSWIPSVERNEFGTPILRSAFEQVASRASNNLMCYVNADIMFLDDLLSSVKNVDWDRTVVAGQRWDVDVTTILKMDAENNGVQLRQIQKSTGILHDSFGMDYFIFRKDRKLIEIPAFAVGRPGWDCWFVYHVRQLGYRMVDASLEITALHQNHDYSHVKSASGYTPDGYQWIGAEADKHRNLVGNPDKHFTLEDATHILTPSGVKLALDYDHIRARWHRLPVLQPRLRHLANLVDRFTPNSLRGFLRKTFN